MCLAIPGRIVAVSDRERQLAIVEVGGVRRAIHVGLILDADQPIEQCVGEWVLVHVGFAMSRIDEQEATRTLALLAELSEAREELEAMSTSVARG